MANVLLVEDDTDTADAIARALQAHGHRVDAAPNGQEALATLIGRTPELIVLDMRLPLMDGVTFMQVLRSYLRWFDIPVIVVTAAGEGPDLEAIRRFDVSAIFHKTRYELVDLVACVNRLTGSHLPSPAPANLPCQSSRPMA